MPRRLIAVVVFLFVGIAAHAQTRGAIDWIFLVDTSKSMRGIGGSKNIFGDVQASIATFIREASTGDSITILTFDRDVRSHGLRDIHSELDREELYAITNGLQANGNRTHLGLAIAEGLKRSKSLLQRNDATRERAIVLFTDGKEDVLGIPNPVSIPSNLSQVAISGHPWLFFVSLGEHESQLDVFTERTKIFKPRNANAIREAMELIRRTVKPPEPPPVPLALRVEPATLDFGAVHPGKSTESRQLTITSNKPAHVSVRLAPVPGIGMPEQSGIAVAPNAPARIQVRLDVGEDVPAGVKPVVIKIGRSNVVAANVDITSPSRWLRIAKWAGALMVLLLVLLVAAVLYSGKTPGELLSSISDRNALDGELEVLAPRLSADAAFIGLPSIKARELALSSIVPLDALAGSDARLFCRRKNGEKQMWIEATSGSLRVNDVEVPASEIYDADTIQAGAAKLRFNYIGHERRSIEEDQI